MDSMESSNVGSEKQLVWLITGTSHGFGECLVHILLARGDLVIATARDLTKTEGKFPKSSSLHVMQINVDDGAQVLKEKVEAAVNVWGRIDVLVNNAGAGLKGLIEECGSEMFKEQFKTNVFGLVDMTTAVLPHMRARKAGTIVMMGSRAGWNPIVPTVGPYGSSKAAVHALSETLAIELGQFNIRILVAEPGAFHTDGLMSLPVLTPPGAIPEYDNLRGLAAAIFRDMEDTFKGDPMKAMGVIVDVVRGEGKARGRPWPPFLMLGDVAYSTVREKMRAVAKLLDDWEDVGTGLDFDA